MDNEQARFLLRSFRPDGADAGSQEFAEALKLAAENRELGEWLAQERAEDAAFAQALNEVPIPDSLRDEIFAVLEYDGQATDVDAELESLFMGGLNSISPPDGLRDQILASMNVEKAALSEEIADDKVTDISTWRWLSVAAVAAAVAVGVFIAPQFGSSSKDESIAERIPQEVSPSIDQPAIQQVAVHSATFEMATKLTAPETIGLKTDLSCTHDAMSYLKDNKSPVPAHLPPGLEDAKLIGCRNMYLESGQPVSLLCFQKEGVGMVHLIAFDKKNLSDANTLTSLKNISLKNCYGCSVTNFNIVHWNDGETTYMILTKAEKEDMVKLF